MRFALLFLTILIAPIALVERAAAQSAEHASSANPGRANPGLGGVWVSRWITPLERQKGIARLVLTPEETKTAEAAEWARHNAIDPIEGTDNFEFTHFVVVRGETRSSLIVDP